MRTTLDLDEDVLPILRALSRQERRALGAVTSDLVRRALQQQPVVEDDVETLPAFTVRGNARLFGPDEVAHALEEP